MRSALGDLAAHVGAERLAPAELGPRNPTGSCRLTGDGRGASGYAKHMETPVIVKKGQVPRAAVAQSLRRRLGADVTLWPQGRLQHGPTGDAFTAKWYDAKTETYREARVEVWDAYQRGAS